MLSAPKPETLIVQPSSSLESKKNPLSKADRKREWGRGEKEREGGG